MTGTDIAADLIAAARERAKAEDLSIDRTGDAERLPFTDGEFDAVVSTYGIMFASRPEAAAAEVARRPQGWTRGDHHLAPRCVVPQEGAPSLAQRRRPRDHVPGDACATSNPSLSSSPWLRGAPQSGFSMLIRWISTCRSLTIAGPPPRKLRS